MVVGGTARQKKGRGQTRKIFFSISIYLSTTTENYLFTVTAENRRSIFRYLSASACLFHVFFSNDNFLHPSVPIKDDINVQRPGPLL